MNQHYLPQFYLRYFTDPGTPPKHSPYVWVFRGDEWRKRSPENIGYGTDFYAFKDESGNTDHRVEHALRNLENLIAPALKTVNDELPTSLSSDVRMYLSFFVISQEQRTPDFLNARAIEMEQAFRETCRRMHRAFENDPAKFEKYKKENGFKKLTLEQVSPDNLASWEVKPVKAFLLSRAIKNWETLANLVFSMNWTILYSTTPVFVTSESPVVAMIPRPDGDGWTYGDINHPNVDISMPLTPQLALMSHWRGDKLYRLIEATENDIRTLNLRTTNSAADALSETSAPLEIIAASPIFPFSETVEAVSKKRKETLLSQSKSM